MSQGTDAPQHAVTLGENPALLEDFVPQSLDEWVQEAEAALKGAPFEKLQTRTLEGLVLKPLYTREDLEGLPHLAGEWPGQGNFLRGTNPEAGLGRGWWIAQGADASDPAAWNRAVREGLAKGQNALELVLEQDGRATGACPGSRAELDQLLEGINPEETPLLIYPGAVSGPFMAQYLNWLEEHGYVPERLGGGVLADPLGVAAASGRVNPAREHARADMVRWARWREASRASLRTVGVSTLVYHEGGAHAVLELACALATGVSYLTDLLEGGLSVDQAARSIQFTFGVGAHFFTEVAKFRAARMLWSRVIDAYGGDEDARKMVVHARTGRINQTVVDRHTNLLRTTTQAFSAVVGGVDSLCVLPFDAVCGVSDTFSRRLARNIQLILRDESQLARLVDPSGGSYYVERLTHELASLAWARFQEMDAQGGIPVLLERGELQREIAELARKREDGVRKRKIRVVGANMYANPQEKLELPAKEDLVGKPLAAEGAVDGALSGAPAEHWQEAARKGISPAQLRAAMGGAEAQAFPVVAPYRVSASFEALRAGMTAVRSSDPPAARVFLATMGPVAQHKARADFSRAFFELAGCEVVYPPTGFLQSRDAVAAAVESGAATVVVCSTDETYPGLVPELAQGLRTVAPAVRLILAGYPKEQVEAHKASGVDDFIFLGCDAHAVLSRLVSREGGR